MGIGLHSTGTDTVILVDAPVVGTTLSGRNSVAVSGVMSGVKAFFNPGRPEHGCRPVAMDLRNEITATALIMRGFIQTLRDVLCAAPVTNQPAAIRRGSASVKQGS